MAADHQEFHESNRPLLRVLRAHPDWVTVTRFADGRFIEVNCGFERISGYRADEVIGKTTLEIGLWADERVRERWMAKIEASGSLQEVDVEFRMRSGEVRAFQASAERVRIDAEDCLITICRDVTARKAHEALLFNIAQGVAAETGESFFRSLARHLAHALDAEFAFVGELLGNRPHTARTVAFAKNGTEGESFEYDLSVCPCAEVVYAGHCAFLRDVAALFPDDLMLEENGIHAYVGRSLVDSTGRVLGLIAVMFRRPLHDAQLAESMLRIFAVRASAELERQRQNAALEHQATHDSLTGLPNRLLLKRRVDAWLQEPNPRDRRGRSALLLIDLDGFKEINDTLGHHAGDALLRQLAMRLQQAAREACAQALVSRLGGDEFAIWLADIWRREDAERVARAMLQAIHMPFEVEGAKLEFGASVGVALWPDHAGDASALLRCADVAMYAAKRQASGTRVYELELDPHSPRRLALMTELGEAVRRDQLVLHFQPRVSLGRRELVGVEALVRWQHPLLGLVPPAQFIPLAEMGDAIRSLTWWVLRAALEQRAAWAAGGLLARIAVNFSARLLLDDDAPAQFERLLGRYGADPRGIELEITESAIIADPARALDVLTRFHAMGVQLSIDDFGTGYSSLAYLKRLPLHALKIDRSFVGQMTRSERDAIIVRSTTALAHNLGLTVVAEGVEDAATLEQLELCNCDEIQGFFVAPPFPGSALPLWVRSNGAWSTALATA